MNPVLVDSAGDRDEVHSGLVLDRRAEEGLGLGHDRVQDLLGLGLGDADELPRQLELVMLVLGDDAVGDGPADQERESSRSCSAIQSGSRFRAWASVMRSCHCGSEPGSSSRIWRSFFCHCARS